MCIGSPSSLSSTVSGGTWTSSNPATVSINASTGMMTGLASGTVTITYTVTGTCGTGTATYSVTAGTSAGVAPIVGASVVCVGGAISLTDASPGGTWSSSATTIATVSGSGVVSGVTAGTVTITYAVTAACGTAFVVHPVTVNPFPNPGVVTGPTEVCVGSSVSLGASVAGGVWSSSVPSNATVNSSGVVTGLAGGTTIIVYSVTNSCGTATALHTMIVTPVPAGAAITGATGVCQGATITLAGSPAGGIWSASNTTATVSTVGVLSGIAPGIDTITYTVTNSCGTSSATHVDTVYPTSIAGGIAGSAVACIGDTLPYTVMVPGGTWHLSNGNAVVDSVTGFVVPVTPGLDTLSYTLTNVCGTYSASMVLNVLTAADCAALGVNGMALEGVHVYPNPSFGKFSVQLPQLTTEAVITIADVTGKTIDVRRVNAGSHTEEFDLRSLATGSYFIKVTSGSLTFRDKLVIW